ncbi:MAG: hypothetical protein L0Y56_15965, partial [Nitrospira sp.]|nr:hypothetical protein [Nitrospira sp.]
MLSTMILLGLTVEVQGASDYVSLSLTSTQNTDNPDLRGFDPSIIASPDDPFPDTSCPLCLIKSTMFGNGVPSGTSRQEVNQNCSDDLGFTGEHPPDFPTFNTPSCIPPVTSSVIHNDLAFQSSRNGLLSRRSTATTACNSLGTAADDRRCNEITFGFLQDV